MKSINSIKAKDSRWTVHGAIFRVFLAFVLAVTLIPSQALMANPSASSDSSEIPVDEVNDVMQDEAAKTPLTEEGTEAAEEKATEDSSSNPDPTEPAEEVATPAEDSSSNTEQTTSEEDANAPKSALVDFLNQAVQAGDSANVEVVVRSSDIEEENITLKAGLVMDEHKVWNLLSNYAKAKEYEGATQPKLTLTTNQRLSLQSKTKPSVML